MIFSTKIEKTKTFETLIHEDFDNNFEKKKNENQHFDMISEFINMQIWTIFFTEIGVLTSHRIKTAKLNYILVLFSDEKRIVHVFSGRRPHFFTYTGSSAI